jgi:hypothetical protein
MKRMIRTGIAILSLGIIATSCDIFDLVDINFTTDSQSADFIIEPNTAGAHYEQVEIITTDIKKQIEDEGGKIDDLQSVKISDLTVSVVSGTANLDAFESFKITIKADGIDEKQIAWMDTIPLGVTSVEPQHITDNLKDFIGEDQYTITLTGVLRNTTTEDITLRVSSHYDVTL